MADVAEPLLDGRPHLLLHDVDVVVVEPEVAAAVLDEAPPHRQDVRLVRLQHLPHLRGRGVLVLGQKNKMTVRTIS